jgi:hypothetical protein
VCGCGLDSAGLGHGPMGEGFLKPAVSIGGGGDSFNSINLSRGILLHEVNNTDGSEVQNPPLSNVLKCSAHSSIFVSASRSSNIQTKLSPPAASPLCSNINITLSGGPAVVLQLLRNNSTGLRAGRSGF